MVVAAGKARDRADAARWLEDQYGEKRAFVPDDAWSSGRRRASSVELLKAIADEELRYRRAREVSGVLLTSEVNHIRAAVGRRFNEPFPELGAPVWEGGYGGRCRDEAWQTIFTWALRNAAVEIVGVPGEFSNASPPPKSVLIRAEEIAAEAMRSLERDARRAVSP